MKTRNFVALMGIGTTLLAIILMFCGCGEKLGPAIHDSKTIREANAVADSTESNRTALAEKRYREEVAISNAFAREVGIANLKIDTLLDKIDMLEFHLEQCRNEHRANKLPVHNSNESQATTPFFYKPKKNLPVNM